MAPMAGKTLYDKIWDAHVVSTDANGESILYIDLHLIHEVTTPQAFAGLRAAHRPVRRPDRTLAVADHNTPTEGQALGTGAVADLEARMQLQHALANAEPAEPAEALAPFKRFAQKVGRNDPCPCGSGKKYKQCHGKLA